MKSKIFLSISFLLSLLVLTTFVQAPKPIMAFIMGLLPQEINATPGDFVTVNGTILNLGWYWLHDFNITVKGLPDNFNVNVTPQWFEHVRILREWNPQQGVYLVPEKFWVYIDVPKNSSGVYLVNVTGKEWMTWRRLENSSTFILRVSGAAPVTTTTTIPTTIPPTTTTPSTTETTIAMPTAVVSFVDFIKANPIVAIIAGILLIIIFWNVWEIVKRYKFTSIRKKPEEMLDRGEPVSVSGPAEL